MRFAASDLPGAQSAGTSVPPIPQNTLCPARPLWLPEAMVTGGRVLVEGGWVARMTRLPWQVRQSWNATSRHCSPPAGAVNPMVMAVADQAGGLTFAAEARHLGETGLLQR